MDGVRDNGAGGSAAADVIHRVLYDVTLEAASAISASLRQRVVVAKNRYCNPRVRAL